jgi:hypothetical protein
MSGPAVFKPVRPTALSPCQTVPPVSLRFSRLKFHLDCDLQFEQASAKGSGPAGLLHCAAARRQARQEEADFSDPVSQQTYAIHVPWVL